MKTNDYNALLHAARFAEKRGAHVYGGMVSLDTAQDLVDIARGRGARIFGHRIGGSALVHTVAADGCIFNRVSLAKKASDTEPPAECYKLHICSAVAGGMEV